ncbi:MAG: nitroreductase family protein [archaeon]
MDFQKVLEKRASVKKYTSKQPPGEKIMAAIDAAEQAPSAGNTQNITYIVVDNPDTIGKIADACQQDFIKQAPWVVIITSDIKQLERLYDVRADKYQKQYVGAAAENFLLKVVDMKLAACWVGAFSEPTMRRILAIPKSHTIDVVIPVGYEMPPANKKPRTRYSSINRIFFGVWGNKFYKPIQKARRGDL